MKKKIAVILVSILILTSISLGINSLVKKNRQASTSATVKVRIANLPIVQGLPLYLALDKGYFTEAGLSVEVTNFEAPNQLVDAIMNNQVDFTSPSGAMGILSIADIKNPGKLSIYAVAGGDEATQNDAILVKNNSLIKKISDLEGKKIGILPGIQWRTIAKHILTQNNLVVDKNVTLVELAAGLQAQALDSGQVDALLAVEPTPTIIKSKGIGHELVEKATSLYVSDPFYGGAGAVRLDFAKQNPEITNKIVAVFKRAVNEINNNSDLARQYLKNHTPLNDGAINNTPISKFKMTDNLSSQDIEAIQKFDNIFMTYNVIDKNINFQSLIFSTTAQ